MAKRVGIFVLSMGFLMIGCGSQYDGIIDEVEAADSGDESPTEKTQGLQSGRDPQAYSTCSSARESYPLSAGCVGKQELANVMGSIENASGGPVFDLCELANAGDEWRNYYSASCTIDSACLEPNCAASDRSTCTKKEVVRHLESYTYYICFD